MAPAIGRAANAELVAVCSRKLDRAAAFAANGQVLQCRRPDPKNRGWPSDMALLIQRRARAKGVDLAADAVDLLVGVLGADTIPLDGELEKLCCYAGGPGTTVTAAMVEELCQGEGEATAWAFLDAVGERKLEKALDLARMVLAREKEEDRTILRLVQMLAGQFRTMLQVRVFMQEQGGLRGGDQVKSAVQRMSRRYSSLSMKR